MAQHQRSRLQDGQRHRRAHVQDDAPRPPRLTALHQDRAGRRAHRAEQRQGDQDAARRDQAGLERGLGWPVRYPARWEHDSEIGVSML